MELKRQMSLYSLMVISYNETWGEKLDMCPLRHQTSDLDLDADGTDISLSKDDVGPSSSLTRNSKVSSSS